MMNRINSKETMLISKENFELQKHYEIGYYNGTRWWMPNLTSLSGLDIGIWAMRKRLNYASNERSIIWTYGHRQTANWGF